ncbi:MAG: hypothetical protein FJW35_10895 [Acidobacteria bacterium]|nr:hypothetical protein [Acidobacteriota bacterium]
MRRTLLLSGPCTWRFVSSEHHLSSDHDPLFQFGQWQADLRILEIDEIKTRKVKKLGRQATVHL